MFSFALLAVSAQAQLGHYFFYDQRLSINGTQSCATCRQQKFAFTDGRAQSTGATGQRHARSAMSLVNLSRSALLTWANPHAQTLEKQMLTHMFGEGPVELGTDRNALMDTARHDATYQKLLLIQARTNAVPVSAKRGETLFFRWAQRSAPKRAYQGFTASARDRLDLLAFLQSLTADRFLNDPRFSDPWPR